MSRFTDGHPGQDLLLLYFDGELSARRARPVEQHLAACWQCRSEIEEFRRTAEDCVRYRSAMLESQAAPSPWRDLSRDFTRIDAELAASHSYGRWALAAAASLLVAAGLFYHFRETPSVEAATLLRKAVAASSSKPVHHHLRVRTKSRVARLEDAPEVRALFVKANYPAQDPLSPASYQSWRDAQAVKTDSVETITIAEPPFAPCYRIRTVTPEGELASASLTLRTADLEPVEGRFEFRNQDWVELTSTAEATTGAPPELTGIRPPIREVAPVLPTAPESTASVSDELSVMAALHGIGADLGDPLQINRSGSRILVSGVGISPERRQQIEHALSSLPHVELQFSDPTSSPLPQEQAPASGEASSLVMKPTGLEARLEQAWGGRAEFERISAQLLDWNDNAMSRVYALRALAQRFPVESEAAMSAADRGTLHDLARAHLAALAARAESIEHALAPVLGAPQTPAAPVASGSWQASTENLYRSARRADLLLTTLLGATRDHSANQASAGDLKQALSDLQSQTAGCRKALE